MLFIYLLIEISLFPIILKKNIDIKQLTTGLELLTIYEKVSNTEFDLSILRMTPNILICSSMELLRTSMLHLNPPNTGAVVKKRLPLLMPESVYPIIKRILAILNIRTLFTIVTSMAISRL
jgi:hypothetical protein